MTQLYDGVTSISGKVAYGPKILITARHSNVVYLRERSGKVQYLPATPKGLYVPDVLEISIVLLDEQTMSNERVGIILPDVLMMNAEVISLTPVESESTQFTIPDPLAMNAEVVGLTVPNPEQTQFTIPDELNITVEVKGLSDVLSLIPEPPVEEEE